ncbi:ScpA family protein [Falsarthrobacter nasiphocae]|uniref:Segregation and condensation protein A n=1 Tax=Falsarthrobacter nasiphocae TaxID=189863 RepID=A0AAE3YCH8_9MICC|nr:ScpA family protein [Falsarthrobacter nasiphocae]MDR6891378.1 segregation and condensation protein A [Falsarthrobacter nasiphocae]
MSPQDTAEPAGTAEAPGGFAVSLDNFEGPFDVLLNLIARKEMDVTRVALAEVTDEFLAYTFRLAESGVDDPRTEEQRLDERTGFLVVAATLLDLKAARLLPSGEVESREDIEALEARDLLFAKLLQYQAFKRAAADVGRRLAEERVHVPRDVRRGEGFEDLAPRLEFSMTPEALAEIARAAFGQAKPPVPLEVGTGHLHTSRVTVAEECETIAARLAESGTLTFAELIADADSRLVLVVRFLALLELYRRNLLLLEQEGETVLARWTGEALADDDDAGAVLAEVDDYEGTEA